MCGCWIIHVVLSIHGNEALARLENIPLEVMTGNTFGSIFPNMDTNWLRSYERSELYSESL